jgi:hypothetical protein
MRGKMYLVKRLREGLGKTQVAFCRPIDSIGRLSRRALTKFENGRESVQLKTVRNVWQRLRYFAGEGKALLENPVGKFTSNEQKQHLAPAIADIENLKSEASLVVEEEETKKSPAANPNRLLRAVGVWRGIEKQQLECDVILYEVELTLRLDSANNMLEGNYVVTWPERYNEPPDIQKTKNGTFREPYVCLEYETNGVAVLFGYIILEMNLKGTELKGKVFGLSARDIEDPIGCDCVELRRVDAGSEAIDCSPRPLGEK